MARKQIVYVLRRCFFTQSTGGRVKTAAMASALAAAGELTVIDLSRDRYPGPRYPAGERLSLPYGGEARFHSSLRLGQRWLDRLSLDPPWLWRTKTARMRATLEWLNATRPDVLVVDHPEMASLGLSAAAGMRVLHTHNLESRLAADSAQQTGKSRHFRRAEQFRAIERDLLPRFDQVWGVREEDLEAYRALGARRCVLAPNVIADAVFRQPVRTGEAGSVLMVGSLNYGPNAEGARYLLELGRRSAERGTPLKITVAGREPGAELTRAAAQHAWFEAPGFVGDLQPLVDRAAVVAAPLAWGAGTKVKVVEALASGKPLVTTPVGAEGIHIEDGVHALVKPLGAAFDEAVAAVAAEPARYADMAARGRQLAQSKYSQAALTATLVAALNPEQARG